MANNVTVLQNFFEAENKRDWKALEACLHPDVMWFLHTEDSHMPVAGREEYLDRLRAAYEVYTSTFTCESIDVSTSGNRIVAQTNCSDGTHNLLIVDFEDGLIRWKHEYVMA